MTLAEIYTAIMSVKATTDRIEQNQQDESERVRGRLRKLEDDAGALEKRVEALEFAHTERCPPPNGADG